MTFSEKSPDESLQQWAKAGFEKHLPLLFIGAAGIAVRTIAPFVQDKTTDSPVLVMDEQGTFVIPLLSGHLGGANDLARQIGESTGARPVITTATDVQHRFAVDVFAQKNGLHIVNRDGIQKVSSLLVNGGGPVTVWVAPGIAVENRQLPPELTLVGGVEQPDFAHILITETELLAGGQQSDNLPSRCYIQLVPKRVCAGMGCKKGKSFEELRDFLLETLESHGVPVCQLCSIHSIDLKKQEEGLQTLAQYLHLPFTVYTADQLTAVPGTFTESAFVEQTTGVSNVCERAAMAGAVMAGAAATGGAVAGAGKDATLILNKTSRNGMTLALAQRNPAITWWKE